MPIHHIELLVSAHLGTAELSTEQGISLLQPSSDEAAVDS